MLRHASWHLGFLLPKAETIRLLACNSLGGGTVAYAQGTAGKQASHQEGAWDI